MANRKFIVIAGPCVVESKETLFETAAALKSAIEKYDCEFYFKSSYKKANRTSASSFTGLGDEKALAYLAETGEKFGVKTLTDVHSACEIALAVKYVDALQIPAFLCRQTELLQAAGATGKPVNVKKGQFMAPEDMGKAVEKVRSGGECDVWLTERGTSFGYHNLVVDFRSFIEMRRFGVPVVFDATHSQQKPSAGDQSGGAPEFAIPMARAAAAVGIDGLFFETHPDPKKALSDASTQLELSKVEDMLRNVFEIRRLGGNL